MEKLYENSETGCCPRFNPEPWIEKEITWEEKLFLKEHVTSFLHIPLNFGKVMAKTMEKIKNANALARSPLLLCTEKSLWRSDVLIAVSRPIPNSKMETLSGTFLTKVFEGGYQNMGNWASEMKAFVQKKGKTLKKLYSFYTTCPAWPRPMEKTTWYWWPKFKGMQ